MKYGKILKEIREENNLSQNDIAQILNIARVTYNHFETQYDVIPLKYLDILSDYFKVSIDYILGLTSINNYNENYNSCNIELFSKRLKEFRKNNKITQEKLAKEINTTHSTIAGYENKRCFIRTSFLINICKKYDISADYLLGKTNDNIKEKVNI